LLINFFKSKSIFLIVLISLFGLRSEAKESLFVQNVLVDTPDIDLIFPINDPLDPTNFSLGLIDLNLPLNIQNNVEYDPVSGKYIYNSLLGDSLNFRPSSGVSLNDYLKLRHKESMSDFWKKNLDEMSDYKYKTSEDEIKIKGPPSKKIFGKDFIEIRPQGSAELSFGLNSSRTDNPVLPERNRKVTTFDFDQKIQMNLTGKIGDLMDIGFNYNTEATFDFDNQLNLDYSGKEDDILQKLEAGNVTLPLNSTLISGSQSLFGIKSELKFGKLTATTVLSQQKGQKKEIEVSGGAQINEFEINVDNYEENRHFFLSFYYRDSYDQSMKTLPIITSGIQIQRIEVWVTNRNNSVQNTRNILCFTDLGEPRATQLENQSLASGTYLVPDNNHNLLYGNININPNVRNYVNASNELSGATYNMKQGIDFEKVENARMLSSNDYTYNSVLGFISLNQSLNNDQVLGVSYQYTFRGKTYQVGELSTDGVSGQSALFLKLLKSTVRNPQKKLWDLMMKNVYSLGAYQVDPQNFRLDIWYNNPLTSVDINYIPKSGVDDKLLIQLLDLDRLNQQQQLYQDGLFDFVPITSNQGKIPNGGTINPRNGRLYFTTVEPFGKTLKQKMLSNGITSSVVDKIAFTQLYDSTKTAAQQLPEINRFKIKGTYQSSVSSEISLNAMNIPQGSVVVTAGGQILIEGAQYSVDYNLGRVKILDDGILSSGTPIKISLESNSLFSVQMKTLLGTHLDYKINKDANIGATIIKLKERPLTPKVNAGDEPISNTMLGLDGGFKREVPFLTKWVDMLPFIETKKKSMVNFSGEVAALIPGHNKAIDITAENGSSYIDDFEGSQSSIDIRTINNWVLASVPQGQPDLFPEASLYNDIDYGKNRAKFSWYVIDPLFHSRSSSLTPSHIKGSADQDNHIMRQVLVNEVFPNKQLGTGQLTNIPVFDISYYPKERGPYNYDVESNNYSSGLNPINGELKDPETRWGGIMRTLTTNDFEAANIEFIQFWVMDPFNEDSENSSGGEFYFNLGNISEDLLRDGRKSFENGLPPNGDYDAYASDIDYTSWGAVPNTQVVVNAFDNNLSSRKFQDIGFDGLSDTQELTYFNDYVSKVENYISDQNIVSNFLNDPSADNYNYYRDDIYDANEISIRDRYKNYNSPDGNSPTSEMSDGINSGGYPTSASTLPNVEDINLDNNLSEAESYFQYKIDFKPNNMQVGTNFITDKVLFVDPDTQKEVYWYQFRVPVTSFSKRINGIQDFRSIRFIRMFVHGWSENVTLRFARLELVRGEWRRYLGSLLSDGEYIQSEEANTFFNVSAVNLEDNGTRDPINYVLPEGIIRETNYQTANLAQQNEQSLVLDVCGLKDGDSRAIYRNVNLDIRNYNKIQMFVHGESNPGSDPINDNEATVFVRLGTDFISNYYEYEMPIKISSWGDNSASDVWPLDNNLTINLNNLKELKKNRNFNEFSNFERFTRVDPDNSTSNITVVGNPNLQGLKTIMIGVRNPKSNDPNNQWKPDDGLDKCLEVWVNELRLSDFNENGGWAAIGRMTANLADFADLAVSGNYSTPGFGSIEKSVSERQQEFIYGLDASSTVNLDKFFGDQSGINLPMYVGYSRNVIKPLYDPLSPDLIFEQGANESEEVWNNRFYNGIDLTERKSINFTNVKFDKKKKNKNVKKEVSSEPSKENSSREEVREDKTSKNKSKNSNASNNQIALPWDISNFSLSYSYTELSHRDINTRKDLQKNYLGSVNYLYNSKVKPYEPFKKNTFLRKSKWLKFVKDFNIYLLPKQIAVRSNMNRTYNIFSTRYNFPGGENFEVPQYGKQFNWDRNYDFKYDITKNLKFDLKANNGAFVRENPGKIDYGIFGYDDVLDQELVNNSLKTFGENMSYNQIGNISYKWPLNKFPLTDWISLTTRYTGNFDWTRAPLALDNDTLSVGNVIQNSRVVAWSGKLNLITLYNKVPYLKKVNKKYGNTRSSRTRSNATKGGPKSSSKKEQDSKNKANKKEHLILDQFARVLMSVKSVNATFNTNDGIILPGYANKTSMLGMDDNWIAPGMEFIAGGYQERDLLGNQTNLIFANNAAENNWLVDTNNFQYISTQYSVNHTENMTFKVSIKPIKSLRIDLSADRSLMENRNANLGIGDNNSFELLNNQFNGSFSSSIITWKTAFKPDIMNDTTLSNQIWENLLSYRSQISSLISQSNPNAPNNLENNGYYTGYDSAHQDVIIGAFMCAYLGETPSLDNINPLGRRIPLPNWRITFDGLGKIKAFKKYIKKLSFTHAYRSNFSLGNYTTNLSGNWDSDGNATETDIAGNFISQKQIMVLNILEQFAPLLGVDMTFSNNMSVKFEYKKDRNISLSLSNNQITEIKGSEIKFGSGYTWRKISLPFKIAGRSLDPSDLRMRLDVSVRDNKTIIRKIIENQNQYTAGQTAVTIQFSGDYNLTKQLMIRIYFDRRVNTPHVSNSFPTANTNAGFALRFQLR
jgi:cell surface protein SprA